MANLNVKLRDRLVVERQQLLWQGHTEGDARRVVVARGRDAAALDEPAHERHERASRAVRLAVRHAAPAEQPNHVLDLLGCPSKGARTLDKSEQR